jgi:hypothetical protein
MWGIVSVDHNKNLWLRLARHTWAVLVPAFILVGIVVLVFFLLPFDPVKQFADSLARDGELESLSLARYLALLVPMRVLGGVLLILGGSMLAWRQKALTVLEHLWAGANARARLLAADSRILLDDVRSIKIEKWHLIGLAGVTLLAVLNRWVFIWQPVGHDESYSITVFAFAPLDVALSDYHMPNNHVFHTLLVHITHNLLGVQPWVVRLPAALSGVLIVPVLFFLARHLYGPNTALLAAGLAAALPKLIHYSAKARGYSTETLITLVIFLLGAYVRKKRNRAAWVLIVIFSALGFYTVPVMFYPYGILLMWLLLSFVFNEVCEEYGSLLVGVRYLFLAGVATIALTTLFYTPVIRGSGIEALLFNGYVETLPLNANYPIILYSRARDTWLEWTWQVPLAARYIGVVGFFISIVLHRWVARNHRVHLIVPAVLWVGGDLLLHRAHPWAKLWIFFMPLVLMWVSAGLVRPFRKVALPFARGRSLGWLLMAVGLTGALVGSAVRDAKYWPINSQPGQVEASLLYIKENLQEGDLIVADYPDDAPLWYYSFVHDVSPDYRKRDRPFYRVFALVNTEFESDLHTVIEHYGPDLFFFDFDAAKPVFKSGTITVYEMIPELRLINEVYGEAEE